MSANLNIWISVAGLITAICAIGGATWNEKRVGLAKITGRGWLSILLASCTFLLGAKKEQQAQLSELNAKKAAARLQSTIDNLQSTNRILDVTLQTLLRFATNEAIETAKQNALEQQKKEDDEKAKKLVKWAKSTGRNNYYTLVEYLKSQGPVPQAVEDLRILEAVEAARIKELFADPLIREP